MMDNILIDEDHKGRFIAKDLRLDFWNGIEMIAEMLQRDYGAKIVEKAEGPFSRLWRVKVRNELIDLAYDDFPEQTWIAAVEPSAEPIVREIAEDMDEREILDVPES